jgi:hypothetical protein
VFKNLWRFQFLPGDTSHIADQPIVRWQLPAVKICYYYFIPTLFFVNRTAGLGSPLLAGCSQINRFREVFLDGQAGRR